RRRGGRPRGERLLLGRLARLRGHERVEELVQLPRVPRDADRHGRRDAHRARDPTEIVICIGQRDGGAMASALTKTDPLALAKTDPRPIRGSSKCGRRNGVAGSTSDPPGCRWIEGGRGGETENLWPAVESLWSG